VRRHFADPQGIDDLGPDIPAAAHLAPIKRSGKIDPGPAALMAATAESRNERGRYIGMWRYSYRVKRRGRPSGGEAGEQFGEEQSQSCKQRRKSHVTAHCHGTITAGGPVNPRKQCTRRT
jgi:hypothetical protein